MMSRLLVLLIFLVVHPLGHAEVVKVKAPAERSRVVVVRPLIAMEPTTGEQAEAIYPKALLDRVFAKTDLEVIYLEPSYWMDKEVRNGGIRCREMTERGYKDGILAKDDRILNLVFVSNLNEEKEPTAEAEVNGNVCYLSLGGEGAKADLNQVALSLAHEMGRCFGLTKSKRSDRRPNLFGEGTIPQRLGIDALDKAQIAAIQGSPLVLRRLEFTEPKRAAEYLINDQFGNAPASLSDDNLRFQLGLSVDTKIPEGGEDRETWIQEQYQNVPTEFTAEEKKTVVDTLTRIEQKLAGKWPMLTRVPWHIMPVREGFCRNMPHTRGIQILLSSKVVARMHADAGFAEMLMVHEKLHVLQRLMPERFGLAYQRYGYRRGLITGERFDKLSIAQNPDAPDKLWYLDIEGKPVLILTLLDESRKGYIFRERLYALVDKSHSHELGGQLKPSGTLVEWRNSFPIRTGWDDPREIIAYLSEEAYKRETGNEPKVFPPPEQNVRIEQARQDLNRILALPLTE